MSQTTREMNQSTKARKKRVQELERKRKAREKEQMKRQILAEKEKAIKQAATLTREAEVGRLSLTQLLTQPTIHAQAFKWDDFKMTAEFSENFQPKALPLKPELIALSNQKTLLDFLMPGRQKKEDMKRQARFETLLATWETLCAQIKEKNEQDEAAWLSRKTQFEQKKKETNKRLDDIKRKFEARDEDVMAQYFYEWIMQLPYPDYFKCDFELEYNGLTKILVVSYELPRKEEIPAIKEVKYIQTKNEYKKTYLKEADLNSIYEESLYQLSLRLSADLYEADVSDGLEGIVFNGYLTAINKSTGLEETRCLLSLQTSKTQLSQLNLARVDAKLCFKRLKGTSGAKLSDLVPVAPIMAMNRADKRFVEAQEIGDKITGYNLAAMHWKDFEHLIREMFEKEFSQEGAEVKITQVSHDGGVDGIIFDPDPIKGGKYIIQAKRYTNVVGVSAVRDLYGTVLSEGASKGILVTTSDYGKDSYEFAKDKPLTLLNGSNLLYILEKHGYEAHIDLAEARVVLKQTTDAKQLTE